MLPNAVDQRPPSREAAKVPASNAGGWSAASGGWAANRISFVPRSMHTGHCARQFCCAACSRYLWTKAIAMLPSPTAEATRLTGLNLTSPQAKTPGTLDSRR